MSPLSLKLCFSPLSHWDKSVISENWMTWLILYPFCQCWPKDIRYSLSSDIRIKMVVIFILSFFYSEWSNNHLIFILSFHFLGIILFEKIRITSNNHSFFKMGKNVISWLLFPSICYSTPSFVCPSVCPSVSPLVRWSITFYFFCFFAVFGLTALAQHTSLDTPPQRESKIPFFLTVLFVFRNMWATKKNKKQKNSSEIFSFISLFR